MSREFRCRESTECGDCVTEGGFRTLILAMAEQRCRDVTKPGGVRGHGRRGHWASLCPWDPQSSFCTLARP